MLFVETDKHPGPIDKLAWMNNKTKPETDPKKKDGLPRFIKSKLGIVSISTITFFTLVGGAYAAYQDNLLPFHAASPSFDNLAESQIVTFGINTESISENQLQGLMEDNIKPVVKGQYPNISALFPIKLTTKQNIKEYTRYDTVGNWMNNGNLESVPMGKILVVPHKGTEMIMPFENAQLYQIAPYEDPSLRQYFPGAVLRFKGPDGTPFEMTIVGWKSTEPTYLLRQAPMLGKDGFYGPGWNQDPDLKGLSVPLGDTILMTSSDNAHLFFELGVPAPTVSTSSIINPSGSVRFNFHFVTILDSATGNTKVALYDMTSTTKP
jgi:hypothetical protein